jgi:hypothetical protein
MSLPLLGLLVVVGVGLIVLLVHLAGYTAPQELPDDAAIVERFYQEFRDERVLSIERGLGGTKAVLLLQGGGVGVVVALGDRTVTRKFEAREARKFELDSDRLAFDRGMVDFGFRPSPMRLPDRSVAVRISDHLNGRVLEEVTS